MSSNSAIATFSDLTLAEDLRGGRRQVRVLAVIIHHFTPPSGDLVGESDLQFLVVGDDGVPWRAPEGALRFLPSPQ